MIVLSLQSHTYDRGVDRVVKVANLLPSDTFLIAGRRSALELGRITKNVGFIGEVNPIEYLKISDVLVRFTRRNDPWGRDILEALSVGVPVVATGSWQGFVKHRVNGYLMSKWDVEQAVDYILQAYGLIVEPDLRFRRYNMRKIERVYENLIFR